MESSQKPSAQTVIIAIKALRMAEKHGATQKANQIRSALKEAHQ